MSIVGEGEWASAKRGEQGKRGWQKLHIGVTRAGQIQTQVLTDSSGDDAKSGIKIIKKPKGKWGSVTGDAAYDTLAIYEQAGLPNARLHVFDLCIGAGLGEMRPEANSMLLPLTVGGCVRAYSQRWASSNANLRVVASQAPSPSRPTP